MPRELTASDRMQLVNIGQLMHPGACAVCGNGTCQFGYIQLGVYFEYEGEIYLCMTCLTQAAETGGMLSVEEAQYIQESNNTTATELLATKNELKEANEQLDAYISVFKSSGIRISGPGAMASDPVESNNTPDGNVVSVPVVRKNTGKSVSLESIAESRPSKPTFPKPSNSSGSGNFSI